MVRAPIAPGPAVCNVKNDLRVDCTSMRHKRDSRGNIFIAGGTRCRFNGGGPTLLGAGDT